MSRQRMKDLPQMRRPRERLLALGVGALSDAELLALFIVSGSTTETAVDVARRLISEFGSLSGRSALARPDMHC